MEVQHKDDVQEVPVYPLMEVGTKQQELHVSHMTDFKKSRRYILV